MSSINEQGVIQEIIRKLKLSPGFEKVPVETEDKVRVVFVANEVPCVDIVRHGIMSSTTVTLFTTPADKDFFLTSCSVSILSSGLSGGNGGVFSTFNGTQRYLLACQAPVDELTTSNNSIVFNPPIKMDRGVVISGHKGHTQHDGHATITGYLREISW